MEKIKRFLNYLLWGKVEITKEDLDFYRQHPKELESYINKDFIHIRFLRFYFLFAILIVFATKSIMFYYREIWNDYLIEVVFDIIYKCGLGLLGGTITAYLLGYLRQREYQESVDYRNQVMKKLKEEDLENS